MVWAPGGGSYAPASRILPRNPGEQAHKVGIRGRKRDPGRDSDTPLGPPVTVLEPDDIVQLGRAHLEDDAIGQSLEAVTRPWRQVHGLPLGEHPLGAGIGVVREQEPEPSLVQVDGLVLALVVLQAQRLARADAQDFPGVARRAGEQELLAPRLRQACHAHGLTSRTGRGSVGTSSWTLRRASSSIASAESSLIASSTRPRASFRPRARIVCLTDGMAAGFMLSSVIPSPISTTAAAGRAAISPHTDRRSPRRAAASTTPRRRRRMAGCRGW